MKTLTDDEINELLLTAKPCSIVLVRSGPNYTADSALALSWEHNRRNFALRERGLQTVYLRITDDSDVYGVAVFDATVDTTIALMNADPGVAARVFTFEVHPCRGIPGDALP